MGINFLEFCGRKIMRQVLVIVAHPDDEVIGCGASISKWTSTGISVHILIMAEGATSRDSNASEVDNNPALLAKSAQKVGKIIGASSVKLLGFPDNRMDSLDRLVVIKEIEKEIKLLRPDTVVTHHAGDVNIDHRIIHESVVTACRPQPGNCVKRLLAFEVLSSTEWQTAGSNASFHPNWFEDVSEYIDCKIKALKVYESEIREWPHARSLENVEYLARFRGATIGCYAAESFVLLRAIQ